MQEQRLSYTALPHAQLPVQPLWEDETTTYVELSRKALVKRQTYNPQASNGHPNISPADACYRRCPLNGALVCREEKIQEAVDTSFAVTLLWLTIILIDL